MRSRWNTTKLSRSSETLVQRTMTNEVIQGHEQTTYVTLTTSSTVGMRDCLPGASPTATESP
jgi:hypothetical protein